MPDHFRGPMAAHVQRLYDPDEPVPHGSCSPDMPQREQDHVWRWCYAWRRAQDERQAWFTEHGYTDALGHVDWHRLRADQARLEAGPS